VANTERPPLASLGKRPNAHGILSLRPIYLQETIPTPTELALGHLDR